MSHSPVNVTELGHHHEVSDAVLKQRLEDAAESARYWKAKAATAETPLHRTRASGLHVVWKGQAEAVEREMRVRRIAAGD